MRIPYFLFKAVYIFLCELKAWQPSISHKRRVLNWWSGNTTYQRRLMILHILRASILISWSEFWVWRQLCLPFSTFSQSPPNIGRSKADKTTRFKKYILAIDSIAVSLFLDWLSLSNQKQIQITIWRSGLSRKITQRISRVWSTGVSTFLQQPTRCQRLQCHSSHSGSLLQNQCNLEPWNIRMSPHFCTNQLAAKGDSWNVTRAPDKAEISPHRRRNAEFHQKTNVGIF